METQPGDVIITVILKPDGSVQVGGPLGNKLICYGMLELARQSVHDYDASKRIQPAGSLLGVGGAFGPIGGKRD